MEYKSEDFQKAKVAMLNADKICIISHRAPDGMQLGQI